MYTQKSFSLKTGDIDKKWWIIDATDLIVGRLSTEIATLLRGKHKPTFTPTQECGDFVVITNCDKIKFTGNKWDKKTYYWHTGYIGGIKKRTAKEQMIRNPEKILMDAVKGMLPKTRLGRKQLTKLKLFVGNEHEHSAQQPVEFKIN